MCYQKLVSDKLDLFWSSNLFFILIMQSRKSIQAAFVEKKNFLHFLNFFYLSVAQSLSICFVLLKCEDILGRYLKQRIEQLNRL